MHVKPQTLHMIASKCPGNSERRELFDRHEVSMVCPGNMPIFVATLTPLAPLVFQTAGMKCISGCKVWTKFLSVASLWMLQHQPSLLYLILAFWLKVYWKLAQKKCLPKAMISLHKRMQRTACGVTSALQGRMTLWMGRKILEWSLVVSGVSDVHVWFDWLSSSLEGFNYHHSNELVQCVSLGERAPHPFRVSCKKKCMCLSLIHLFSRGKWVKTAKKT